jgi:hypothetical protein
MRAVRGAETIDAMTSHRRFGTLIPTVVLLTMLLVASALGSADGLVLIATDHGLNSNEANDGWGGLLGTIQLFVCVPVLVLAGPALWLVWGHPRAGYRAARAAALWSAGLVLLGLMVAVVQGAGLEVWMPYLLALSPLVVLFVAAHIGANRAQRLVDA